jgi:AraC family transcriptional regulator
MSMLSYPLGIPELSPLSAPQSCGREAECLGISLKSIKRDHPQSDEDGRVTEAEDAFASFLSMLAEHLDEHELRGPDLAAKLYVSRSLLDRFVAATAGETTARLRRRVLLERAAFRLKTTPVTILHVAADAGYSSNEAFTRAFRRAYGVSPASWRASPGQIHIPAGNGVHFYPPGGLRLSARTEEATVIFVAEMVDHHVAVIGHLLDRAATLPDDTLNAPIQISVQGIDDNPTIRSLLSRLVGQLDMWNAAMASEPYDFTVEDHQSIDSMRSRLITGGQSFARFVRTASEQGRLGETFVDATGDVPYEFTAAGMIAHVLTYAAHRRTLVVGALASAGAPDVDDDPLSWFAP